MSLDLALPSGVKPSNLHLPDSVKVTMVEADVYDVCGRIREISPDVYVILAQDDENSDYAWIVMEDCVDGVQRLIVKASPKHPRFQALDGRLVEHLRFLYNRPLPERLKELEKEESVYKAQQQEAELDELYERVGRPMWTQLDHDGFIPGGRGVSYPKRGVAGGKGSKERS